MLYCCLECDEGFYGKNCHQQCQCVNAGSCDHVTGMCHCNAGWTGTTCAESKHTLLKNIQLHLQSKLQHSFTVECPQGNYGQACAEDCTCRNITECDHVTGVCSCQPGYTGDDCAQGETIGHIHTYTHNFL